MLLSIEKRFIFVHIPKTAGQSITQALGPYAVRPQKTQWRRLLSHLPVPENPERAWLRTHDTARWIRRKLPAETRSIRTNSRISKGSSTSTGRMRA